MTNYKNLTTEEIIKKQKEYVIPCTPRYRQPVVLTEGRGVVVKDLDGNEYIDCFGGYAVVNVGHCHPKVVKAIQEQASLIHHTCYDYYNVPQTLLAEKLAQISPYGLKKSFFCVSGAEAVEGSIKLTKKYAYKQGRLGSNIVALFGSFHGRTTFTIGLTGQKKYKVGMGLVFPGVVHVPMPYCYRCLFKMSYPDCNLYCAEFIDQVISYATTGDIAAFIAEPVLGEGGIIPVPRGYLEKTVAIVRSYGGLFIVDEVQTGFGRTGKMFAVEHYNAAPDIMAMAKGLSGSIPIGAFIAREDVANAFEPGDHSSTWGGNAVHCAAALASIEVIMEEKLPEKAEKLGRVFMDLLKELADKHSIIGDVRGLGLMIGVELVKNRSSKDPAVGEAARVRDEMRKRGVLIGCGGVSGSTLRLQPPLVIEEEHIHKVINTLDESLKAVQ